MNFSVDENKDAMGYEQMKSGAVPVNHQYVNIQRRGKYLVVHCYSPPAATANIRTTTLPPPHAQPQYWVSNTTKTATAEATRASQSRMALLRCCTSFYIS